MRNWYQVPGITAVPGTRYLVSVYRCTRSRVVLFNTKCAELWRAEGAAAAAAAAAAVLQRAGRLAKGLATINATWPANPTRGLTVSGGSSRCSGPQYLWNWSTNVAVVCFFLIHLLSQSFFSLPDSLLRIYLVHTSMCASRNSDPGSHS